MSYKLSVRLLNADSQAMPEGRLRSLYSSDLHFEPMRRHSEIGSDGTVTIDV